MKRLLHFHEDMSIANSDAGCNIPLILLLPATFLLHTQQTHSGLGKTHPQLCCCAGYLLCLSLWSFPAQNCPVRGSLSFSLPFCHITHCYCLYFKSSACALPVPPHWALWGKRSPPASPEAGLHYPLPICAPHPPKSIFVLSPAMPHRDVILTLQNIMADVSFFTLLLTAVNNDN